IIIIKELSRGSYGRVLQVSLKLMPEKEIVMKRLPFLEKQEKNKWIANFYPNNLAIFIHFFDLTSPISDRIRLQVFEIQHFLRLIRLSEHSDILVVVDVIHSLFNILTSGAETASHTEPHPHFDDLSFWNGIENIFQLFRRNLEKNYFNYGKMKQLIKFILNRQ
ncbi:MAG: hypothetical protein EZS28_049244, partial [Streblomastix strix]